MNYLVIALLLTQGATKTQANAPHSPTQFQESYSLESDRELESLGRSASTQVNDQGGGGKLKTISLRGFDSSDLGVTLEGIRLNSTSQGYYNFGELETFGLDSMQILRGGSAYLSASPAGEVLFRLPSSPEFRSMLAISSYESLFAGQLTPNGSLSIHRSKNDFLYYDNGTSKRRDNNESFRSTLRVWKRTSDSQWWMQFQVSDHNLPGPVSIPRTEDFLQSHQVLTAYQKSFGAWSANLWTQLQNQESLIFDVTTQNVTSSSGARLERTDSIFEKASVDNKFEFTYDYLNGSRFPDSNRASLFYAGSLMWGLTPRLIFHPRIRVEYLSDMDQPLSIHPASGVIISVRDELRVLSNISWISRAPTFYELYFEDPFFQPNPRLKRQSSLQYDLGVQFEIPELRQEHVFFVARSTDVIQTVQISQLESQTQNFGKALTWGFENSLNYTPNERFELRLNYSYQRSQRNEEAALYRPKHKFSNELVYIPHAYWSLFQRTQARSRILIPDFYNPPSIDWQWDLAAGLEFHRNNWRAKWQISNLLAWRRQELGDYPLAQEPQWKFELERKF